MEKKETNRESFGKGLLVGMLLGAVAALVMLAALDAIVKARI